MILKINDNIQQNKYIKSWLNLAIFALIIAGIFSILLVSLRTPGIESLIPYKEFFRVALIVHVDLSVLIWLLAISCMLGEFIIKDKWRIFSKAALVSCFCGTILIALSPCTSSTPIINNYIPVLENIIFFTGLGLFFAGSLIHIVATILSFSEISDLSLAIISTKLINLIAFASFFISANKLTNLNLDSTYFYELLFWACGHILQFSYVNLMLIAWIIISENKKNMNWVFILNSILSAISLISFVLYDIDSLEFKEFYTMHMRYFGGVSSIIVGYMILPDLFKIKSAHLTNSYILFFIGGLIGIVITSSNVTIPAHYHGSIVGVTIALMGLTFKIIPMIYNTQIKIKSISTQAYLYGIGQMLHIIGLAWSGGYGALRKTPGAAFSLKAKLGMGLMGFGGLLAIIAGIMFVVICVRAIYRAKLNNLPAI